MAEYIVRETGYPGAVKQEIVGELVRCKDCKERNITGWCPYVTFYVEDEFFCAGGERKDDDN